MAKSLAFLIKGTDMAMTFLTLLVVLKANMLSGAAAAPLKPRGNKTGQEEPT